MTWRLEKRAPVGIALAMLIGSIIFPLGVILQTTHAFLLSPALAIVGSYIKGGNGRLRFGALTRHAEIESAPDFRTAMIHTSAVRNSNRRALDNQDWGPVLGTGRLKTA